MRFVQSTFPGTDHVWPWLNLNEENRLVCSLTFSIFLARVWSTFYVNIFCLVRTSVTNVETEVNIAMYLAEGACKIKMYLTQEIGNSPRWHWSPLVLPQSLHKGFCRPWCPHGMCSSFTCVFHSPWIHQSILSQLQSGPCSKPAASGEDHFSIFRK